MNTDTLTTEEKAVNLKFALYMGAVDASDSETGNIFPKGVVYKFPDNTAYPLHGMKYVRSWDWLLPVWKKVGAELYEIRGKFAPVNYELANVQTVHFLEALKKVELNSCIMILQDMIDLIKKHK